MNKSLYFIDPETRYIIFFSHMNRSNIRHKISYKIWYIVYKGPYINLGIDIAVPFSLYSDILIVINLDIGFILIHNRNRHKLIYKLNVELYISNFHIFPLSA